jgi:hypothetical protein
VTSFIHVHPNFSYFSSDFLPHFHQSLVHFSSTHFT